MLSDTSAALNFLSVGVCLCCNLCSVVRNLWCYLYIIIGLSRWPRGVAYVNGRTAGTGGKRQAVGRNRGLARRRRHGLRRRTEGRAGTNKSGQTDGQADGLADGPNRVQIDARFWLVHINSLNVVCNSWHALAVHIVQRPGQLGSLTRRL